MSVQILSPGIKPRPWAIRPGRLSSLYRPFWTGLSHAAILHHARDTYDVATRLPGSQGSVIMGKHLDQLGATPLASGTDTNEYVSVPYPETGVATLTFAILFRATVSPAGSNFGVANTAYSNSSGYRLRYSGSGSWRWRVLGSGGSQNVDVTQAIVAGDLMFIVGRLVGGVASVSVHNVTAGEFATGSGGSGLGTVGSDSSELRIGADSTSSSNNLAFHAFWEWRRDLQDTELLPPFSADPFGTFRPARRRAYRAPAVGPSLLHYRFRNDDGSESGATWKAAEDVDVTVAPGEELRFRALVAGLETGQYQLEAAEDGTEDWFRVPVEE